MRARDLVRFTSGVAACRRDPFGYRFGLAVCRRDPGTRPAMDCRSRLLPRILRRPTGCVLRLGTAGRARGSAAPPAGRPCRAGRQPCLVHRGPVRLRAVPDTRVDGRRPRGTDPVPRGLGTPSRALAFPIAFLLFMIPLPALVFNQVAFPLQLLASRLGAVAISATGVPVLRKATCCCSRAGPWKWLRPARDSIPLVPADAGDRPGLLHGEAAGPRAAIAIAAVPIAVIANAVRVAGNRSSPLTGSAPLPPKVSSTRFRGG